MVASDLTDTQLLPHVAAQAKASNAAVTLVHVMRSSPIERPKQDIKEEVHASRSTLGQMKIGARDGRGAVFTCGGKGSTCRSCWPGDWENTSGAPHHRDAPAWTMWSNMIGSVANALLLTATVPDA